MAPLLGLGWHLPAGAGSNLFTQPLIPTRRSSCGACWSAHRRINIRHLVLSHPEGRAGCLLSRTTGSACLKSQIATGDAVCVAMTPLKHTFTKRRKHAFRKNKQPTSGKVCLLRKTQKCPLSAGSWWTLGGYSLPPILYSITRPMTLTAGSSI